MSITTADLRNAAADMRVAPCLRHASECIIAARLEWAANRIDRLEVSARAAVMDIGAVGFNLLKVVDEK